MNIAILILLLIEKIMAPFPSEPPGRVTRNCESSKVGNERIGMRREFRVKSFVKGYCFFMDCFNFEIGV